MKIRQNKHNLWTIRPINGYQKGRGREVDKSEQRKQCRVKGGFECLAVKLIEDSKGETPETLL